MARQSIARGLPPHQPRWLFHHTGSSKLPSYELSGEIDADESYFGGVRKGKRGRGAAGKVAVFGLLKRGAKVFTAIIPNAKTETLLPIIQERVEPDSIVYTDTFRSYDALDVSDFHHSRVNHSELFADQKNHINGIENFWNQSKRHWPPVQRHQTGELLLVSQGV